MRSLNMLIIVAMLAAPACAADSSGAAKKAAALTGRSTAARKARRYQACVNLAGRAIAMDPSQARAYVNRGTCLFALGRDAAALKDLDEAARLAPGDENVRASREALAEAIEERHGAAHSGTEIKKLQPAENLLAGKAPGPEDDAAPVKPDGKRCVHPDAWGGRRYCNWYDALDYCGGKLPPVQELLDLNQRECPAGSKSVLCGCRYWSAEDGGNGTARTVTFAHGGDVDRDNKKSAVVFVHCLR